MAHWLVTRDDHQFRVEGKEELLELARKGELTAGDMVQPPGAADWLYAAEIPELAALFDEGGGDAVDLDSESGGTGVGKIITYVVLALFLISGGTMAYWYMNLPTGEESLLGEGGLLSYSEIIVKGEGVKLRSEANPNSSSKASLAKDQVVDLLAKRGDFYRVKTKEGTEGWISYDEVVPMYLLGGAEVREDFDPLYNPDRYCNVRNASWMALDYDNRQLTVFNFYLFNEAKYEMTDLVIRATIKDSRGNVLETLEIPVEGIVPARTDTFVGMIMPEGAEKMDPHEARTKAKVVTQHTFYLLRRTDPDLNLRYFEGVEVEMTTNTFTEANIEVVELRAIPK